MEAAPISVCLRCGFKALPAACFDVV